MLNETFLGELSKTTRIIFNRIERSLILKFSTILFRCQYPNIEFC